jgi:Fe-S-cluster containining protein
VRAIAHRYLDPLDQIWTATARRIGLRIERSGEVYASTDGAGTLIIGQDHTLDPDDCLAQMIFHELCHSLIEGADAFARPDWGLDNTGAPSGAEGDGEGDGDGDGDNDGDVQREHACLRLQAVLAAEHGLRRFFAPTTDFRDFYDDLPDDPLQPRHLASVTLAILGARRAKGPPWAPHLDDALQATAAIARQAARFAGPAASQGAPALPAMYAAVEAPLERHPLGLAVSMSADPDRTCATCAWRHVGGRGRAVDRCRQAGDARVSPEWRACERWEPALDCQDCGACCREAYDSVTVSRRDPVIRRHPALIVDRGSYVELARVRQPGARAGEQRGHERDHERGHGTRCTALHGGTLGRAGQWQPYACTIYDDRPRPCRELERGGAHCLTARRRVGLSR